MGIKTQLLNYLFIMVSLAVVWLVASRFMDYFDALVVAMILVVCQSSLMLAPQIKRIGDDKVGPLVLDCGPNPHWPAYLLGAVLFLLAGLASIPVYLWGIVEDMGYVLIGVVACGCCSSLCLLMAISRLELREDGLRIYFGVLTWENIMSYAWEGEQEATLRYKSNLAAWAGAGSVRFPPECKEAIEAALQSHSVLRK